MKSDELITILAGAVLAYVAYKTFTKQSTQPPIIGSKVSQSSQGMFARGVANSALPGQDGWGWDYFDNGVAISPSGDYYLNGTKVWSPSA